MSEALRQSVVTSITSNLAKQVMHPHGKRGPVIERLAKASYQGHGIAIYGPPWDALTDAQKERWRWTACAVLLAADEIK